MLKLGKLRAFHNKNKNNTNKKKKKKKNKPQTFYNISSNTIYSWKMILFSSTIWLILCTTSVYGIQSGRLMAPNSIIALSGDVHVQLQLNHNNNINNNNNHYVNKTESNKTKTITEQLTENVQTSYLVISKLIENPKNFSHLQRSEGRGGVGGGDEVWQNDKKLILKNVPVYPDPRHNVTQITVPCETFAMAGKYEMQFVTNLKTINPPNHSNYNNKSSSSSSSMDTTLMPLHDERLHQTLDVRWPQADITLSHTRLSTYPETTVKVTLRFPQVNCKRILPELQEQLADFYLELLYCGKDSSCSAFISANLSKASIFWSEQIHGFVREKTYQLNCELFGLAGIYAVQLRPMQPDLMLNFPLTRRYINVDWSEKFVFNVFARSIFPCDPHTGIGVLFEYPRCILEQGDRVRVYAKLRADVASLKPPTSLHYVAEQRVIKNQYSLHFSCDLFTEKFVEYCFVYVSQGVSGAVADVRMDCVPTLPVSDSDTGGWGPWSEWTPCSTNCLGGTRNRYRFCDSPPPRYGAKFCEGSSVQTEKCGGRTNADTWNCIYDSNFENFDYNNQNKVSQAIGPGCRCGCIVHIGSSKSKRLVAGALQSCPGKSFWLIQADSLKKITLSFRFLRLPCASQYMKVRDGPSLLSTLIHEVQGNEYVHLPQSIDSTGAQLLIEIYAGDQITSFAKEKNQSNIKEENSNLMTLHCNGGFSLQVQEIYVNKSNTVLASTKQLFRTRDIKRIIRRSGLSIVHISVMIFASIIILISTILGIQFILRYQKYHLALAQNCEDGLCLHPPPPGGSSSSLNMLASRAVSTTTLISEVICLVKMRSKPLVRHSILRESVDVDCMTKPQCPPKKDDQSNKDEEVAKAMEIKNSHDMELDKDDISSCSKSTLSPTSMTEEQIVVVDVRQKRKMKLCQRKSVHDVESSIESTSMNTPCNSPTAVSPRLANLRADCSDKMTVKMLRAHFDELVLDSGSVNSKLSSTRPSTDSSMTNGQYSPLASCVVSTAAVRSTNLKEKKEKQNRKKLLSRPNSDMSIGGNQDTELEMDYYDYDVINAAAAPGSYFSMDPAHLIWIPPFENENNLDDIDIIMQRRTPAESISSIELNKTEQFYKEMKVNKYRHFCWPQNNDSDDGSITPTNLCNYTTTTSFELLSLQQHATNKSIKAVSPSEANNFKNTLIQQTICAEQLNLNNSKLREHTKSTRSLCNINTNETLIRQQQHHMLFDDLGKSVRDITAYRANNPNHNHHNQGNHDIDGNYMEKETSVVKSQSDLQQYLALDDIQFADDSESEYENSHNIGKA